MLVAATEKGVRSWRCPTAAASCAGRVLVQLSARSRERVGAGAGSARQAQFDAYFEGDLRDLLAVDWRSAAFADRSCTRWRIPYGKGSANMSRGKAGNPAPFALPALPAASRCR
jgi:hypothetical protein